VGGTSEARVAGRVRHGERGGAGGAEAPAGEVRRAGAARLARSGDPGWRGGQARCLVLCVFCVGGDCVVETMAL
jgi:hypothetical protein